MLRMMGFPETCKKRRPDAQQENATQQNRIRRRYNVGISTATAFNPKPSNSSRFLPMRAANKPPGTLKTANAMKTKNDNNVDTTLLSL